MMPHPLPLKSKKTQKIVTVRMWATAVAWSSLAVNSVAEATMMPYWRDSTVDLLVLTSLDQLLFCWNMFFYKTRHLNEEVECTEISPSVSIPWFDILRNSKASFQLLVCRRQFPLQVVTISGKSVCSADLSACSHAVACMNTWSIAIISNFTL